MTDQKLSSKETPRLSSGAPTKYREDFHGEEVRRLGKLGYTISMIASEFNVHRDTVYEWARVHEAFSATLMLAKQDSKNFLIKKCIDNIDNCNFNVKIASFLTRFVMDPEDRKLDEYVHVPGFNDSSDPKHKLNCVMDALGCKKITPKEAQQFVDVVERAVKCMTNQSDVVELIEQLKEQINNNR